MYRFIAHYTGSCYPQLLFYDLPSFSASPHLASVTLGVDFVPPMPSSYKAFFTRGQSRNKFRFIIVGMISPDSFLNYRAGLFDEVLGRERVTV